MTADTLAGYEQRVPRYTSYPTAPHFGPGVGPGTYAEWLGAVPAGAAGSLYLHVPFCAELCLYCGCHTVVARRYGPIAAYVALLEREIGLVAERIGRPLAVGHVHWGGGTPTILAPDDLRRVAGRLCAAFDLRPDAEIAVEIDPRTLSAEHVAALRDIGVNRASLGVQDFDAKVQRVVNRVQPYEVTARAVDRLREAGVAGINFDLIYGLPHQTVESVLRSVDLALGLGPDRIALFGYAHVPWMKRHQALLPEDALPGAVERMAQFRAGEAWIRNAGYARIGLDHFARPEDPLARAQAQGRLRRNFQGYTTDSASTLIGFGTSAIGLMPQGYVQNAPSVPAYRDAVSAGRLATVRGVALTDEDRVRGAVIERLMCDFDVDLAAVCAAHGRDPACFAPELAAVDGLGRGLAMREGYRISVPEEARPLVRTVCAVFDAYLDAGVARYSRAV